MTYYAPNKEIAERIAARLTKERAGLPAAAGSDRTVTRYIVDQYAYPGKSVWGVVERWTYNDRPDLPEFGGGFTVLTADLLNTKAKA